MIKKILKKIFFLIIILIYPIANYAALSSADGSAFITKGEFETAITDFNSRLTTFEAGLNSKIDSQVTSYLDRNGIWNGKKQKIETASFDVPTPIKQSDARSTYVITNSDYHLICECTKSGMMKLKTHIQGNGYWGYVHKAKNAGTKYLSDDGLSVLLMFQSLKTLPDVDETEDPNTIKNVWALYLGASQPYQYVGNPTVWDSYYTLRMNWPTDVQKMYNTSYFFVSNKNKIYVKFKALMRSTNNISDEESVSSGNGKVYIDEIDIY